MKKTIKSISSILMIILIIVSSALSFSAAQAYDANKKCDVSLSCSKADYKFNVYQIADVSKSNNPYEIKYNARQNQFSDAIQSTDYATLLTLCDNAYANNQFENSDLIATYDVNTEGNSKALTSLEQGIYYIAATNYPAGVRSVTNSIFALPYYDKTSGWIYSIEDINLSSKFTEETPTIEKTITNSSKSNVYFTEGALDSEIKYQIKSSTVGSSSLKCSKYEIFDTMAKGLTLVNSSVSIKVVDADNKGTYTLTNEDYSLTQDKSNPSNFTIALTSTFLNKEDFYKSTQSSLLITYSAKVNDKASTQSSGNINAASTLTYSNIKGTTASVEGNNTFVYTYRIEVTKSGSDSSAKETIPLANAHFALYNSKEDAEKGQNEIATGISDETGKVLFKNTFDELMLLTSGTYYIKETQSPEGYSRFTDVITVEIKPTYYDVESNGTYINTAPENGVVNVLVKNNKVFLPQTGGSGTVIIYILASTLFMLSIITFIVYKKKSKKTNWWKS